MKKNCKVKYKVVPNNSLATTKNFLIANKVIDSFNSILDLNNFRLAVTELTENARKLGYFPNRIIREEQNGRKAVFDVPSFKKIDGIKAQQEKIANRQPELFQKQTISSEGQIAAEKTIRDLAARMSDRIGIPFKIISDRSQQFKGKIDSDGNAIVNLAYATLDTPIHEIIAHPIIRALKNKKPSESYLDWSIRNNNSYNEEQYKKENTTLYQNLLKELEYGKGKEVLDRIKRDYQYKENAERKAIGGFQFTLNDDVYSKFRRTEGEGGSFGYYKNGTSNKITEQEYKDALNEANKQNVYSLEEQQEEAIVELLGLMTAEKLDAVKDGKLISLLKRLLKEIKAFVKDLLKQNEIEIDKLPDNLTLNDLSDILAYSNSKLILPGYEVIYTTPDNQQFKTKSEAKQHLFNLAKNIKDVNLSNTNIRFATRIEDVPNKFSGYAITDKISGDGYEVDIFKDREGKFKQINPYTGEEIDISNEQVLLYYNGLIGIKSFIEKNKEYEQSKEIIEEWKKVNNIQYNPEEIYSRGQEFSSVVGAYSDFDVNLMMQNLLQHIEDNKKAGGEFTISAFTKPIDRKIGHLEGGGGKIKFKIYPKSKDIKWAANTDVYSGSVWDASEKVSKDKKSELLGVSYTKYPSLRNVNDVQPNLASIVDDLAHHHNELGISLTGNNFRLEYDNDIPYSTKKIIDSINSILDQKYGK